ncbi:MFS transporter [Leptolyngbya sp. ST-U4]|uniref:MFS transporter n=1 Tax=Leptolyngbya sp. ST-U4 TaxID=2933912 RepID=UPI0019964A25|nr:MFS transporter [Cyanobacteria bacterium FACHB-502]
MRIFVIVWTGQFVSTIGSYMTSFAITLWAWQLTDQATALTLIVFFNQAASLLVAPFAGVIVDGLRPIFGQRWSRKQLIILSDTVAALSTVAILLLHLTGHLQVWHFYVTSAINGIFSNIQELAYSTSIALMLPKQHYTRASSMVSMLHYGPSIFAPALAGVLYYIIGLFGILWIDLFTFSIAIFTVLRTQIPQPVVPETQLQNQASLWQDISSGFRYVFARPGLFALLVISLLFWFAHDLGGSLYSAMILARSNNNAAILASLSTMAGVAGVIGAIAVSIGGGFRQKIHGFLGGMIGAGISKTLFGLGQLPSIWLPAQFCSSLNFPLLGSSSEAIWLAKIKPEIQGRVFATRSLLLVLISTIAALIAGPLADFVFEPAMMPGGYLAKTFGGIFGTGSGAGMALLYVITSVTLMLVGMGGYAVESLRMVEMNVSDHDTDQQAALSNSNCEREADRT